MNRNMLQKLKFFMFSFSLGFLVVVISFLVSLFVNIVNHRENLNIEALREGMFSFVFVAIYIVLYAVKKIYNNKYNLLKLFIPMVFGGLAFTEVLIFILKQFLE